MRSNTTYLHMHTQQHSHLLTDTHTDTHTHTHTQMRWFIVLAGGKMYAFKREGHAEPQYIVDVKDFYSLQRFDEKNLISILLTDKTRIPLSFDEGRQFQNFWFSLMATMANQRGMSLPRFVSRVTIKQEYWCNGAMVLASALGTLEKGGSRPSEVQQERRNTLPKIPPPGGQS